MCCFFDSQCRTDIYIRIALFGRTEGSRTRGKPRKKWLANVKEDCVAMN